MARQTLDDPFYYLVNFHTVLAWLGERYGDLLSDDERAFIDAFGEVPRAAQALMMAVRAKALLEQRLVPSVADVAALARPALKHRMALTFSAKAEGQTIEAVIDGLVARALDGPREAAA